MVDYLEESLERAEALLEEVRRLERGLSGLRAEQEGEALEDAPPSGANSKSEQTEKDREDVIVTEAERPGAAPLLEDADIPSPLPSYEEKFSDTASEKAGELKPPERVLTPLEEPENQTGGPEGPGALEAPRRVLKPLEVQEGRTDGEESGAQEGSGRKERPGQDGTSDYLERSGSPALLRQMERLERAAAVSAGDMILRLQAGAEASGDMFLRRQVGAEASGDMFFRRQVGAEASGSYPVSLPGPGAADMPGVTGGAERGWAVGTVQNAALSAGAGRNWLLSADETRWAERADRVFRRDSRRYDGGFYLY